MKIKNIMITSFLGLGNTINLIPLAEKIKRKNPCKKVIFLVLNDLFKEILEKNPFIDKIIKIPEEKSLWKNFYFSLKLKQEVNNSQTLFITTYPHGPRRDNFIKFFYNPKYSIVVNPKNRLEKVLYQKKIKIKKNHDVVNNLKAIKKSPNYLRPKIFLSESEKNLAKKELKDKKIKKNDKIIGIHPGCDKNNSNKRLPIEEFYKIIIKLKRNKRKFLIFFGPDEKEMIPKFERILKKDIDKTIFLISDRNIKSIASLISVCERFISNDSGLMHIAEGVGVKKIDAFFLESKIYRNAPLNKKNRCYKSIEEFIKKEDFK